jgi:hypothetical protein
MRCERKSPDGKWWLVRSYRKGGWCDPESDAYLGHGRCGEQA